MDTEINPGPCLSEPEIREYVQDTLSPQARRRVELHMQECTLCAEAVEGYQEYYDFNLDTELDDLKLEIASQVAVEQEKRPRTSILSPWVLVAFICLLVALGLIWIIARLQ